MKQVFRTPRGFSVVDVPPPALPEDGVLVRVERSLISAGTETMGTQLSVSEQLKQKANLIQAGLSSLVKRGFTETFAATKSHLKGEVLAETGYAAAGTVVASSGGAGLPELGARVACAGATIANHAEVVAIPRRLLARVPEGVSFDEAAYATLGAIALHGLHRARPEAGERALVLGLGLVGLIAAQLARAAGLIVTGLDRDPSRVARARALGLVASEAAPEAGSMDMVLLCAASPSSDPTNLAVKLCRRRGRVVLVGATGLEIDREALFKGEVDLLMSTSYGPGRHDPAYESEGRDYPISQVRWTEERNLEEFLRLIAAKSVNVAALTDRTFPLDEAPQAFASFSQEPRPVGVLLSYSPEKREEGRAAGAVRPGVRVALVGAGEFVRAVHVPEIARRKGFAVTVVANRTSASATMVAKPLGARATTEWREAIEDADLVVVGTRHATHARIAAAALALGKHVLLEKPIATTREGLALVRAALAASPRSIFLVGHNRRFSPHARALAAHARDGLRGLVYRVNAPAVPASSWIQHPAEGGRIVGEGTHFTDLLMSLGEVELVSAAACPVFGRDSYQALFTVAGAPAVLAYSAQGGPELGKERVEVELSGDARAVLEEWSSLRITRRGQDRVETVGLDKGYAGLWDELEKALRGEENALPKADDAFRATELAFLVDEKVRGV